MCLRERRNREFAYWGFRGKNITELDERIKDNLVRIINEIQGFDNIPFFPNNLGQMF
jgi:hypothetical protein